MDERAKHLAEKILRVIEDEPFEVVMPVLGDLQVFLLTQQAEDSILAVDQLAESLRRLVRDVVNSSATSAPRTDGVH